MADDPFHFLKEEVGDHMELGLGFDEGKENCMKKNDSLLNLMETITSQI